MAVSHCYGIRLRVDDVGYPERGVNESGIIGVGSLGREMKGGRGGQ